MEKHFTDPQQEAAESRYFNDAPWALSPANNNWINSRDDPQVNRFGRDDGHDDHNGRQLEIIKEAH